MRWAVVLLAAVVIGAAPASAATRLRPGSIDLSYGSRGSAVIRGAQSTDADFAFDAAGRTVVATTGGNGFLVRRLEGDGSVDPGFGVAGTATFERADFDGNAIVTGLAMRPDGRILVVGQGRLDTLVVLALTPDGAPDPDFGDGGVLELRPSLTLGVMSGIVLAPDGTLYVGTSVARNQYAAAQDVLLAVDPAGRIVRSRDAGPQSRYYERARLIGARDGTLTIVSGRDRTVLDPVTGAIAHPSPLPFVLAGPPAGELIPVRPSQYARLVRVTPDGALDADYGRGGYARLPTTRAGGVAVAPDAQGRTLVGLSVAARTPAGTDSDGSDALVSVTRLRANGTRDPGFTPQRLRLREQAVAAERLRRDARGRALLLLSRRPRDIRFDYGILSTALVRVRTRAPLARVEDEQPRLDREGRVHLRIACLAHARCSGRVRFGGTFARVSIAARSRGTVMLRARAGSSRVATLSVTAGSVADDVGQALRVRGR